MVAAHPAQPDGSPDQGRAPLPEEHRRHRCAVLAEAVTDRQEAIGERLAPRVRGSSAGFAGATKSWGEASEGAIEAPSDPHRCAVLAEAVTDRQEAIGERLAPRARATQRRGIAFSWAALRRCYFFAAFAPLPT